jgi:predicted phosphodiesterase
MKRLWIADVHASLPAFEAVLTDAGAVDDIVFIGDIVGCGPHPSACVDLLRQLDAKVVIGNHDASVIAIKSIATKRPHSVIVENWDEWTFNQLNESQLSYIEALPRELTVISGGVEVRVMHNPPGVPYLCQSMPDSVIANYLRNVPYPVVFCGHSHRQIDRTVNGHRYVCIPPVGQSRNGDTRAGYAIENDGVLSFHYVPYDIEQVVVDIKNIGLPEKYCKRWISFLRAGFDVEWSREYKHEEGTK